MSERTDPNQQTSAAASGRTLADGRYLLVRKLAEGGTAIVHLGYDSWSDEWRAVKTLLPEYTSRPALRHRFELEARTMTSLDHPNIIAVYDAGVDGETAYMVMEYAEGGSVIDWVDDHGPMPPPMAVEVAISLCAGIQAAHEEGIIHRDVKPQNVLVMHDGSCKVTDFGIAQVVQQTRMTMTGTVMGTIGYMAPEQHESAKHIDERADVYSIAATLYTLARGEAATHLFMADDSDFEGLPPGLAAIIQKGAQYRREARHASVTEMRQELERLLPELDPVPADTPPMVSPDVQRLDQLAPPVPPADGRPDLEPDSLPPSPQLRSDTVEPRLRTPTQNSGSSEASEITPSSVLPRAALTSGPSVPRGMANSRREVERRQMMRWAAAGGVTVVGITLVALLILALVGSSILERAETRRDEARTDLFEAIHEQRIVLGDLRSFPTDDAEQVAELYNDFDQQKSSPTDRLTTARALVSKLEQEKRFIDRALSREPSPDLVHIQKRVDSTIRGLDLEMGELEVEQRRLEDLRGTPAGSVADFFGLP